MTHARIAHTSSTTLILLAVMLLSGCQQPLYQPSTLAAPYPEGRTWAVAPFANESGVSIVDTDRMSDLFTYEVEQMLGVRTIPVNRVLSAMRGLNMKSVSSEGDAVALLHVLDVDSIVVGTITAFDTYAPLQLGMSVELITREYADSRQRLDPRAVVKQSVGAESPLGNPLYVAQASGVFDASNHAVRQRLREYAHGRTIPDSAFGERIFDVNIEQYTRFVAHELLYDLLRAEQTRIQMIAQAEAEHE